MIVMQRLPIKHERMDLSILILERKPLEPFGGPSHQSDPLRDRTALDILIRMTKQGEEAPGESADNGTMALEAGRACAGAARSATAATTGIVAVRRKGREYHRYIPK